MRHLLLAAAVLGCSACSGGGADQTAAAVVSSLGAVPIPTSPATAVTPTASGTHPAVLAMGAPVLAVLDADTEALVTATGPEQAVTVPTDLGSQNAPTTPATITLTVQARRGTVSIGAGDLSCRDDSGADIALTPVGPADLTAAPGGTARLLVSGVFRSGAAQLTLAHSGQVVAIWDFTIELD